MICCSSCAEFVISPTAPRNLTPRRQLALLLTALVAGSAAAAPQVTTQSGVLAGICAHGLSVFKGVPFAAAPVGERRWQPPAAVSPWAGIREAPAFAPACMQEGVSMPGETPPAVSEDCLYLNIWAPAKSAAQHLPVMVWIHGGGYRNGSASMPLYWGDRLAHQGMIVVTIAYRLWYVFGHLEQEPWHWSVADVALAHDMSGYWSNFVRSGDPNGSGLPSWSPFTNFSGTVLYLGDPVSSGKVANLNSLKVLDGVYSAVRGKAFGER